MSHQVFHQNRHPPGKLERLVSDKAHILSYILFFVIFCILFNLGAKSFDRACWQDKRWSGTDFSDDFNHVDSFHTMFYQSFCQIGWFKPFGQLSYNVFSKFNHTSKKLEIRLRQSFGFSANFFAENAEPFKFALCLETALPMFSKLCSDIA